MTDKPADKPTNKPAESVWDFPRPPRVELVEWRIRVVHAGETIVDAPRAFRVLETSQPPAYYIDPQFIDFDHLVPIAHNSFCEWKGLAFYADIKVGDSRALPQAAWHYPKANPDFKPIEGCWAFYAQLVDECWVDDEQVQANPGSFYGGWITSNVTGPFKGVPGSSHW